MRRALLTAATVVAALTPPMSAAVRTPAAGEVVLYAANATRAGSWQLVADASAADGRRLWNPNAGVPKLAAAAASPTSYFDLTFHAEAGVPYHLWLRMKADGDDWVNDSVFVQFSDSLDAGDNPIWRIGTTSATVVSLEDCSGCGSAAWGWNDNGYGTVGSHVVFAWTGIHTIRIQQREDGISIDQVVLSPVAYLTTMPGAAKNDTTVLEESNGDGVTPPPPPPPPPGPGPGPTPTPTPSATLLRSDFNGDGKMDLLWQNISDGYLATWSLNGTSLLSSDLLSPSRVPDTNWRIAGTGDFNGDFKPDIVWHEQTQGWVGIWLMNGLSLLSSTTLAPAARERVGDTNWKIAGVVDLNNDGKPDVLWQERTQGWLAVWLLNGLTVTASIGLDPERVTDTNWKVVANGDFNGDGKNDLIWQHLATGRLEAWFMNGVTRLSRMDLSPNRVTDTTWIIVAAGDVDVDGKMDLVWQDQAQGWLAIWLMNGVTLKQSIGFNPERVADTRWKIVGPR